MATGRGKGEGVVWHRGVCARDTAALGVFAETNDIRIQTRQREVTANAVTMATTIAATPVGQVCTLVAPSGGNSTSVTAEAS